MQMYAITSPSQLSIWLRLVMAWICHFVRILANVWSSQADKEQENLQAASLSIADKMAEKLPTSGPSQADKEQENLHTSSLDQADKMAEKLPTSSPSQADTEQDSVPTSSPNQANKMAENLPASGSTQVHQKSSIQAAVELTVDRQEFRGNQQTEPTSGRLYDSQHPSVASTSNYTNQSGILFSGGKPRIDINAETNGDVAFQIKKEVHYNTADKSAEMQVSKRITAMLQAKYRRLQIPKLPWLGDWYLPLKNYYVDLTMTPTNNKKGRWGEKVIKLQDIFSPIGRRNPTRILVEGAAGYGKTTLALKLCYDFGVKEDSYMKRFDQVIFIRLRDFEGSLDDMILKNIDLKNTTSATILNAIQNNQKRVLFILDGWDELKSSSYEYLLPLLNSLIYPEATVIVTSRIGSVKLDEPTQSSAVNLLDCYDTRIQIKGVIGYNKIQFLECYLRGCPKEKIDSVKLLLKTKFGLRFGKDLWHFKFARKLKRIFGSVSADDTLLDCPLFLLLLVTLAMETDIESVETQTDLYKALFNFVVRRGCSNMKGSDQLVDLFEFNIDDPPYYVQQLHQLGRVAYQAVCEKKFALSKETLSQHCDNVEAIIAYGFLLQYDSVDGVRQNEWFEPVHLSLLEFLGAYYIWLTLLSNPSSIITELARESKSFSASKSTGKSLLFTFLFGLLGRQLPILSSVVSMFTEQEIGRHFIDMFQLIGSESKLDMTDLIKAAVPLVPNHLCVDFLEIGMKKTDFLLAVLDFALSMKKVISINSKGLTDFIAERNNHVNVDKIDISGKHLLSAIQINMCKNSHCRELKFDLTENFNNFKVMGELITKAVSYETIHLELGVWDVNNLQWLIQVTNDGFLKGRRIFVSLEIDLRGYGKVKTVCLKFLELIQKEFVEGVHIVVQGVSISLMEHILRCLSESRRLQQLCVTNICKGPLYINLGLLCNDGKKKWTQLEFHRCVVVSYENIRFNLEVKMFLLHCCFFVHRNAMKTLSLHIGEGSAHGARSENNFFTALDDSSPLVFSLKDLFVSAKDSFMENNFYHLLHLKKLRVLALDFSSDCYYSSTVLGEFFCTLSCLQTLQRLELCNVGIYSAEFISTFFRELRVNLTSQKTTQQRTKSQNQEVPPLSYRGAEVTQLSNQSRTLFQSLESIQLQVDKEFVDHLASLDNEVLQIKFSALKWLLTSSNVNQVNLQKTEEVPSPETMCKMGKLSYAIFSPAHKFAIQRVDRVHSDDDPGWCRKGFKVLNYYTMSVRLK